MGLERWRVGGATHILSGLERSVATADTISAVAPTITLVPPAAGVHRAVAVPYTPVVPPWPHSPSASVPEAPIFS